MLKFTKSYRLVIRNAIWKHSPDELKCNKEKHMCQCDTPTPPLSPNSVYLPWGNFFLKKGLCKNCYNTGM